MAQIMDGFLISHDKNLLQIDTVQQMLHTTYWAKDRTLDVIQRSIDHSSMVFGVYHRNTQVGFARCVTDYTTIYYLCDIVIDKAYRGKGLGKSLIRFIVAQENVKNLRGLLLTSDAHGLYEQYGFAKVLDKAMMKAPV